MGADDDGDVCLDGAVFNFVRKETLIKKWKFWLLTAATADVAADTTIAALVYLVISLN